MNTDITDIDPHRWAVGVIPWYVNGTLEATQVARLSAHLDDCRPCRSDYEAQVRLFDAMQSADNTLVFAAEPSFRKLMARITTNEDAGHVDAVIAAADELPLPAVAPSRRVYGSAVRWLAAAVIVQGMCLAYGAWAWQQRVAAPASSYVTLTSPAPAYQDSPHVRIVFRSGMSMQGLGALLHGAGAHIIDGPTDANVYTLGFARGETTPEVVNSRVTTLRNSADVLFAEPIGMGSEGDDQR